MTNVKEQFAEMLRIQDETNSRLDPDWKSRTWNFLLAAKVEAAEAVDHLGYKWWSSKAPDYAQARMECVDIWHFILSELLTQPDYFQSRVADALQGWVDSDDRHPVGGLSPFEEFLSTDSVDYPAIFMDCCDVVGLPFQELYKLYIGKAALNRFRWSMSYGDTYNKVWSHQEDNEHLTEILESLPAEKVELNHVINLLKQRYAEIFG